MKNVYMISLSFLISTSLFCMEEQPEETFPPFMVRAVNNHFNPEGEPPEIASFWDSAINFHFKDFILGTAALIKRHIHKLVQIKDQQSREFAEEMFTIGRYAKLTKNWMLLHEEYLKETSSNLPMPVPSDTGTKNLLFLL